MRDLTLLRDRRFGLLWLGGLISLTGNGMLFAGLPLAVYQLTDSTLATGVLFIVSMIPRVALGTVAGVFVDRWDRRRVLVVANLALAVTLLPLLLVQSEASVWIVYVVSIVQSSLSLVIVPAEGALLPRLVGEERLVAANALNALNNQIARLIGPAIGGVVVGFGGLGAVAVLDSISYLAAALLIGAITVDARPQVVERSVEEALRVWARLRRDWVEGMRVIHGAGDTARMLLAFAAITGLGEGVIITLFVPYAVDVLDGGGPLYGALISAQAIGGLIGGVALGVLGSPLPPARLLALSAIVFGSIDLVIFTYPAFLDGYVLALVLMVVVGLPRGCAVRVLHDPDADGRRGCLSRPAHRRGHHARLVDDARRDDRRERARRRRRRRAAAGRPGGGIPGLRLPRARPRLVADRRAACRRERSLSLGRVAARAAARVCTTLESFEGSLATRIKNA